MRAEAHEARVVLAFPDFETYRTLAQRVRGPLRQAGIETWLIAENGNVDQLGNP